MSLEKGTVGKGWVGNPVMSSYSSNGSIPGVNNGGEGKRKEPGEGSPSNGLGEGTSESVGMGWARVGGRWDVNRSCGVCRCTL